MVQLLGKVSMSADNWDLVGDPKVQRGDTIRMAEQSKVQREEPTMPWDPCW